MEFFQNKGFTSTWTKQGTGKKILFIPGWAESHSVWEKNCPFDLVEYEKYFFNLGGHFPSEFPKNRNSISLDEFLESHFEVFNHVAGNEKLTLVGHSTGGFVAKMYANQFPEKVDKAILVGSFIEGPIGGIVDTIKILGNWNLSILIDLVFGFYQNSDSIFYDAALSVNPANKKTFLEREDVKDFFPTFFEEYKKMNPKFLRLTIEILDSIRLSNFKLKENLPLYFIHGEKDPTVPYFQVKNFCNHYKSAKLIVMKDIGHSPHWENPILFWKNFREILEK